MKKIKTALQKQAFFDVTKKSRHGTSRHKNKHSDDRVITSISTERKYVFAVGTFLEFCREHGHSVRKISLAAADDYLQSRSNRVKQKTLDGDRQAIQMTYDVDLRYIASLVPTVLQPRAYSRDQIEYLIEEARPELAFSIELAAGPGLRAHELNTIARPADSRESVRNWLDERFVHQDLDYRPHVVIGKGGLIRTVMVSNSLSDRLEARRLPNPIKYKDRGIDYKKYYSVLSGQNFSQQFSRLSERIFGWSEGAHGLRHRVAQDRYAELTMLNFTNELALEIVAQELGHFFSETTKAYLR